MQQRIYFNSRDILVLLGTQMIVYFEGDVNYTYYCDSQQAKGVYYDEPIIYGRDFSCIIDTMGSGYFVLATDYPDSSIVTFWHEINGPLREVDGHARTQQETEVL